jgi:hypothetical protein
MDGDQLTPAPGSVVYVHESFRQHLKVDPGQFLGGPLPATLRIKANTYPRSTEIIGQPDILVVGGGGGGDFWRWDGPVPPGTGNQTPTPTPTPPPTPTPTPTSGAPALGGPGTIILVCPADSRDKGCG